MLDRLLHSADRFFLNKIWQKYHDLDISTLFFGLQTDGRVCCTPDVNTIAQITQCHIEHRPDISYPYALAP